MKIMVLSGEAQSNLSFYPLESQFNSFNYNPAFLSSQKKSNFSIFPMGGTSIGYNNQQVIKKLVTKSLSGNLNDDVYKDMLKSMVNHSLINQKIESNLLTLTFLSKVGYFNFRIKEVESFSAAVKGELTNFIINPGIQRATINQVQNLPAQAMHYREYSLGYSFSTKNNKLAAGIRAKIYFGKSAFFSEISGRIISDPTDFYTLKTKGEAKLSFPDKKDTINVNSENAFDYLMNSGNRGIGVDLGINYRILPELTLSMSIIDLGGINWKNNLNSKSFNGEFTFPKKSVRDSLTETGVVIIKSPETLSYMDTISTKLDLTLNSSRFSKPMPLTFYTGLTYQINPSLKINLVDRYVILKSMNYNSFTVLASFEANEKLSFSAGYSIIGNSFKNIPFALLIKRDFGQIFIGSENLLALFIPSLSDFSGITFGTCFYLFKNKEFKRVSSDLFPSFKPRVIKKNRGTGTLRENYPEF